MDERDQSPLADIRGTGASPAASIKRGVTLLAIGAAGAWFATEVGIPAGAIVGALLFSGAYRLAKGDPGPWRSLYGHIGRFLLGTVIGAAFGTEVLAPLSSALLPMMVLIFVIVGVGILLGWALGHFRSIDTATALISAVPGGLPAMVAIADETDADTTVVAAIHFSRLTAILIIIPALIPLLTAGARQTTVVEPLAPPVGPIGTAATLLVGASGEWLAARLRVPTADLLGSLVLVSGLNLLGAGLGPLATGFRTAAMILIGISVGTQISRDSLAQLRKEALPAAAVIATLIVTGLALGWAMSRVTSLDLATALLSGVPGGASTMPAIAHDLGGDMRLVAALHLARQLVIFLLVPPLLGYLLNYSSRGRRRLVKRQ